jgi:hypothetical protein
MDSHFAAQSGRVEAWFTRRFRFLARVSGLFALLTWQAAAQTNPLVVSTVAGLANFGSADGIDSAAKFLLPSGVAVDGAGNVYVADTDNCTIRKISTNGVVTTIAGQAGISGTNNGPATTVALFAYPYGVAIDSSTNIYVADTGNNLIREITNGSVTNIGVGASPAFSYPYGVATDSAGNVYVADTGNSAIRKITNSGGVGTIGGGAAFYDPLAVATDSATNVYVADTFNSLIRVIPPAGPVRTIATNAYPYGIAVDGATNIYVAEHYTQIIRVITSGGGGYTLAGVTNEFGDGDGLYRSPEATFKNPWGVAVDSATNVYVGDSGNGNIRKITSPSDELWTWAGPDESYGVNTDGPEGQPRFNQPNGVAVDGASNLYVADSLNNCIRMVTPAGTITTLAGSINGYSGITDGTNYDAGFNNPSGLCIDAATNIYVADYDNSTVRKITPDAAHSNWFTTTIAGLAGVTNFVNATNGANARFDGPYAVAVDGATNLYVTDVTNKAVRKLTLNGTNWAVTNYPGAGGPAFISPRGIAVDSSTNVYVADSGSNLVYMIAPGGAVTSNGGALFNSPQGVAVDKSGNIYVANTGADTILGITSGGKSTNTIAGTNGWVGSADGLGFAARFDSPVGLAVDVSSNVYVADVLNNTIRKGTPYTAQTAVLTLTTSPDGLPVEVNGTNYAYTPQVFAFATNSTNTVAATTTNTVTATTTNGFIFTNWTTNGIVAATSTNYTFTLGSNETLVANFIPGNTYALTVSASPANGGTVSGGGIFAPGSTITVTATNNSGYAFTGWTSNGIATVSTTNYTFTLVTNVTLVANFAQLYTVTVSASPTNGGTVSPGGTNDAGNTISVTATNNSGYAFTGWTSNGIATVSTTNYTFTLVTNVTLVANFVQLYTVTVSASPANGGTVSPGGTNDAGSTISVTATNNSGYVFAGWTSNGIATVSTTNYTFTLITNVTLVADFSPLYTVTVSASPANGGTVSGAVTNVSGSTNTVRATNNSGYIFTNWTQGGTVESISNNYTFILGSNEALVANFLTTSLPLLSIFQSNGLTFLTWPDSTNSFGLESTTNLSPAVWVVVTNSPTLSGGFFTVSNVWTNQMRYFQLVSPVYTLTLSAAPTNGGTVGGGGMFPAGSTNTVTATANGGYVFTNWTQGGTGVSISNNYTFTLGSNETLVANFLAVAQPLLSITQSNGETFLFWTNTAYGFRLESTTNLSPANWAAVTNTPVASGGYLIVSNAWPDQTRFFQLISP